MAKALTKAQPSSSVAGMLEAGVGAGALAKPAEARVSVLPVPIASPGPSIHSVGAQPSATRAGHSTGELAFIARQFKLTPTNDNTLKTLTAVYSEATQLEFKHSELLRAILIAIQHAMPELKREAVHIGKLKRLKNERGNEAMRDKQERKIAQAFIAGMRAATLMTP